MKKKHNRSEKAAELRKQAEATAGEKTTRLPDNKEALRAKIEEMDRYFTLSLDLLCIADTSGHFIRLNPEWEKVLGYSLTDLEGRLFLDFVHPDDMEDTLAAMSKLDAQEQVLSFENRYRCKDGSYRWIEWRSHPQGDLIYATARDITDRKQSEEALRKSEREMETMLQTMADGMVTTDITGRIIYSNQAAEQILGIGKDILGKYYQSREWRQLDEHGEPYPQDQLPLAIVLREQRTVANIEHMIEAPNGERKWLSVNAAPLFDDTGQLFGGIATFRDITERKQTERALQESEERFRSLFQSVESVAVQGYGMDGTTQYWNQASERLYGYTAQEAIGQNLLDLIIPSEMREGISLAIRQMSESGQAIPASDLVLRRKDGSRVAVFSCHAMVQRPGLDPELFCLDIDLTERKQTEEALRESKERFHRLADNAPDIIFRYDLIPEMKLAYINSAVQAITGYTPAECYADPYLMFNMAHPDDTGIMIDYMQKRTPPDQSLLMRWIGKDGITRWMESRIMPVYDADGQLAAVEGITRDITDRKQAEEALRESEERLKRTESVARFGNWELNLAERKFHASAGARAIYGLQGEVWTPAEVQSLPLSEYRAMLDAALTRLIEHNQPYNVEFRIRRPGDGQLRDIHSIAEYDPDRRIVFGVINDITDRKRAEEALRESEERFRFMTEHSSDVIWHLDRDYRFTYISPADERMRGFKRDEVIGTTVWSLLKPEGIEHVKQVNAKRLADEQQGVKTDTIRYELEQICKDGSWVWTEENVTAHHNQSGALIGYHGVTRNISDRKQAEEARVKLEAQTRQIEKADSLNRMAGAIAHHFNNQLQSVIGYLELALMNRSSLPDTLVKNLSQSMRSAQKAAEVSRLMLTYRGQTAGDREPLDFSEACNRGLPLLQAAIPKNVVLQTDLPSPGPIIKADENQLHQLLTNLVTNAWEAIGDAQGTIRLSVKTVSVAEIPAAPRFPPDWQPQDKAYACLTVTDTGCGIAGKDIENLFDPFFSTKFTGRGLGLPVVLGIVRAHAGVVTVESQPGRGSTFRVFLPLIGQEVSLPAAQNVPVPALNLSGTVLLVEDEEPVRQMAEQMLTALGFTVLAAKDGVEAVEIFKQYKDDIQCVLCDLIMPHMDGWETLAVLRQITPDVPVILSSGYDEARVMAGNHSEHPQTFLEKPFQITALKDALFKVMVK